MMKIELNSIRTKCIILGGLLLFMSMGILGGISYYYANKSLSISEEESMRLLTENARNQVIGHINEILIKLESVANTQTIKTFSAGQTPEEISAITATLREGMGHAKDLDMISYIRADGMRMRPGSTKLDSLKEREYYKKILETKQNYVSEVLLSASTGKLSIVLGVPVLDNGQFKGIVIGTFTLDKMSSLVTDVKYKNSGTAFLVDEKGTVIVHGKHPEIAGKLSLVTATDLDRRLKDLYQTAFSSGTLAVGNYSFDKDEKTGVFEPITLAGGNRWIFSLTTPEDEVLGMIHQLRNVLLGTTFICILVSLLIVTYMAGALTRPIIQVSTQLKELAGGDLCIQKLEIHSDDEIGILAQACNHMVDNLKNLITQIQRTAEQTAASSEELTASADQSAEVTQTIAQSITGVSELSVRQMGAVNVSTEVINEISIGIEKTASAMDQAAEQTKHAVNIAREGNDTIDGAVKQMSSIEHTVNKSAQVVTKLGQRSKEIGQIVDTIAGIAGQTNLLALNAAIEAARAGEQGKGFAVVAEEVRKLAEQSQEAAKQIGELISEIQQDTEEAVVAMNSGTQEVREGTGAVTDAGKSFVMILESVDSVNRQSTEIARTMNDLTSGVQKIVNSVQQIVASSKEMSAESQSVSAATEQQSASMQEIASASRNLAILAQKLQEASSHFKL